MFWINFPVYMVPNIGCVSQKKKNRWKEIHRCFLVSQTFFQIRVYLSFYTNRPTIAYFNWIFPVCWFILHFVIQFRPKSITKTGCGRKQTCFFKKKKIEVTRFLWGYWMFAFQKRLVSDVKAHLILIEIVDQEFIVRCMKSIVALCTLICLLNWWKKKNGRAAQNKRAKNKEAKLISSIC